MSSSKHQIMDYEYDSYVTFYGSTIQENKTEKKEKDTKIIP